MTPRTWSVCLIDTVNLNIDVRAIRAENALDAIAKIHKLHPTLPHADIILIAEEKAGRCLSEALINATK
jgi:hypothetical protein